MPITVNSLQAPHARPSNARLAPPNPPWLEPPIWNIPPTSAANRPWHATTGSRPLPCIAERMRHCAAGSFGPPSNARAANENRGNRVARDAVLQIMMVARSGNVEDGYRLFRQVAAPGDLVFRGTRLSTLVRACPDSPMRARWLRELESRTQAAVPPRAPTPAPAAPGRVARPVVLPSPVRPHPGSDRAGEPRPVAPVVRQTDAYDHLVRSPLSVCKPVARRSVAGSLAALPPKAPPRQSQAAPTKPVAVPGRHLHAAPPPLPPKPPNWEERIR